MQIAVGENCYELSTKLGTAVEIEREFNVPVGQIFAKLNEATTNEMIKLISIAAKKKADSAFRDAILNAWDYSDILASVQELVARLMFSGTPEENEKKISKYPASDNQKNALRNLLGMPIPEIPSTGNES